MPTKNAAAANCGFVLHLFVLIVSSLYVLWIGDVLPYTMKLIIENDNDDAYHSYLDPVTFHQQGIAPLVVLFFSTIVIYFILNYLSVPTIHSINIITDDGTPLCSSDHVGFSL